MKTRIKEKLKKLGFSELQKDLWEYPKLMSIQFLGNKNYKIIFYELQYFKETDKENTFAEFSSLNELRVFLHNTIVDFLEKYL